MYAKLLYTLMVLLLTAAGVRGEAIPLRHTASHTLSHPLIWVDPEGRLPFEQVLARSGEFKPSPLAAPALGVTTGALWVRFSVMNASGRGDWFLELATPPVLHEVELYVREEGQAFRKVTASGDTRFGERPVKLNRLILPLPLREGAVTECYLRVTSRNMLRVPLRLATMQRLYETNQRGDVLNGIVAGVLLAFILYNSFVFFSLREPAYIFYVGYVLCWALTILFYNGYMPVLLSGSRLLNSAGVLSAGVMLFSIGFTNSFLQTRRYVPVIYRLRWIMTVVVVPPLALAVAGYEIASFIAVQLGMYPLFAYWAVAGVQAYRKGYRPAIYFLVGFSCVILGTVANNIKDNGALPDNLFTAYSVEIGVILEATILSFALADRVRFYKQQHDALADRALEQAKAFSRQLISTQEQERKRIASELHDSVGQKLVLIKNKALLLQQSGPPSPKLADITGNIADTIQEVRNISYYLRPYQIDLLGFTQAVRSLVQDVSDAVNMHIDMEADNMDGIFSPENEMNIYRVLQECLNNMMKHAGATWCGVYLRKLPASVEISVKDDGKGPGNGWGKGLGFLGIQERIGIMNGRFQVNARDGGGTEIAISIPLP